MEVNRENFLKCLEAIQAGLAERADTLHSSCFVFGNKRIRSYKEGISCSIPSPVTSITGGIDAERLMALLRERSDEVLDVRQDKGGMLLIGRNGKSFLRMEEDAEVPEVESPKKWYKLHEDFGDAIGIVQECASKNDASKLVLVHIHPKWIEASDNVQCCRWNLESGFSKSVLVKQSAIKEIVPLGMTAFGESEVWIHFKNRDDLILSCHRYVEDYPELTSYFDVEGTRAKFPKGLGDATKVAEIFVSSDEIKSVSINLKPGRVQLNAESDCGWHKDKPRKVIYKGPEMEFTIAPTMLRDLIEKHPDVIVGPNRLKVVSGKMTWVSVLRKKNPESNGHVQTRHEEEE